MVAESLAFAWRQVGLTMAQVTRLEEPYSATRRRSWPYFNRRCSGAHVWMLTEQGPWVCDRCPEQRWAPPGAERTGGSRGPIEG
jgi:hypothetical protein